MNLIFMKNHRQAISSHLLKGFIHSQWQNQTYSISLSSHVNFDSKFWISFFYHFIFFQASLLKLMKCKFSKEVGQLYLYFMHLFPISIILQEMFILRFRNSFNNIKLMENKNKITVWIPQLNMKLILNQKQYTGQNLLQFANTVQSLVKNYKMTLEKKQRRFYRVIDKKRILINNQSLFYSFIEDSQTNSSLQIIYDGFFKKGYKTDQQLLEYIINQYHITGGAQQTIRKEGALWTLQNWITFLQKQTIENQGDLFNFLKQMYCPVVVKQSLRQVNILDDDLYSEINHHFEQNGGRKQFGEDFVFAHMLSSYQKVLREKKIDRADQTLHKLCLWKQAKTKHSLTAITPTEAIISPYRKTVLKQTKCPSLVLANNQSLKNNVIATRRPMSPRMKKESAVDNDEKDNQMKRLHLFDTIHTKMTQFANGQISQNEALQFSRSFDDSFQDSATFVKYTVIAIANRLINDYTYIPPSNEQDGILREMEDDAVIGIVGDWGTRMVDSSDIMAQLASTEKASIIIHLGDVYYAGLQNEFVRMTDQILSIKRKTFNKFRYYAIPGNHDYYAGGKGFYNETIRLNENSEDVQKRSFFCLRNKSHTLQIIGLDTGRNGSSVNISTATWINEREVSWAKKRINQFKGQTVLLTHHQPFSVFEDVADSQIQNNYYKQVNTLLHAQLFQVIPKISCWIWGHQHLFMIFKPNAYGIPLSRLLGNSSWQNSTQYKLNDNYNKSKIGVDKYFPGKDKNGYYYHTAMTIKSNLNNTIQLKYFHMTSSYDQSSQRVGDSIIEIVSPPVLQKVMAKVKYHIKNSSGLSYSLEGDSQVYFGTNPAFIQFIKQKDEKYSGPIKKGMKFHLIINGKRTVSNKFISWYYLDVGQSQQTFYFGKQSKDEDIYCGQNIFLTDSSTDYRYGKTTKLGLHLEYYVPATYKLSSQGDPLHIYNPAASNSSLFRS